MKHKLDSRCFIEYFKPNQPDIVIFLFLRGTNGGSSGLADDCCWGKDFICYVSIPYGDDCFSLETSKLQKNQ